MKKVRVKFGANDKVFAKVRGYPAWPARVVGVADESASRMKYHIYFFGTGETAVVKAEDVYSYVDNRNKLGKPRKIKGFNEALEQADLDLSPDERTQAENAPASSADASMLIEEGSTPDRRLSAAGSTDAPEPQVEQTTDEPVSSTTDSKTPKARKRKSEMPEPPSESKKSKVDVPIPETEESTSKMDTSVSESPIKTDLTSRSGRKIKPKKFSDFDEVLEDDSVAAMKSKSRAKPDPKPANLSTEDELIFIHNNETIKIPLNLNKPAFKNHKSAEDWKQLVSAHAESLKEKIIKGDMKVDEVTSNMEQFTKDKLSEKKGEYEDDDETYAILHVEGRLLQLDLNIRSSLGLNKADPDKCLKSMDEFSELPITALMLKKNPEVVETFRRLRRYVGNISTWNMSSEEQKDFSEKAESIRIKADHIFNKMKGLFTVPEGKSFWTVFTTQLLDFNKVTKKLPQTDFYAITKDPAAQN